MTSETLQDRSSDLSALLGMSLFKAVAEGAAIMAKTAPDGSADQKK